MKKFLSLIVGILLACTAMYAQNPVVDNPENKAYFGLRAALDVTCPGDYTVNNVSVSMYDNGVGFELGGIYNVPVKANLYIEPGLKFYYDTYSLKADIVEDLGSSTRVNALDIKKFGMRIPVMAGYHFDFTDDFKLSIFTGPELEIGLSAKEYAKVKNLEVSNNLYGEDGDMNRVNLLWGFGAGITYQHFYFGINGGIGLTNVCNDSELKFHENLVTFSVGYNF